jgi:hypothetical protein
MFSVFAHRSLYSRYRALFQSHKGIGGLSKGNRCGGGADRSGDRPCPQMEI